MTDTKFKVGDKVRLVDADGTGHPRGSVFTVAWTLGGVTKVGALNLIAEDDCWDPRRFELVTETQPEEHPAITWAKEQLEEGANDGCESEFIMGYDKAITNLLREIFKITVSVVPARTIPASVTFSKAA
jgi:hypothetical protein